MNKNIKVSFPPFITTLINLSLKAGTSAKDHKTSTIMTLIKKPNVCRLENKRPIEHLCIISKYTEKAMLEQLNRYMTTHTLL